MTAAISRLLFCELVAQNCAMEATWAAALAEHFAEVETPWADLHDEYQTVSAAYWRDASPELAGARVRAASADQSELVRMLTTVSAHSPATRNDRSLVLSSREWEIAEMVARGLSNDEIANNLTISRRTVEGHVHKILSKTGLQSRTQLASRWREIAS